MMTYNWLTIVLIDTIIILIIIMSSFINNYELWWGKDLSLQRAENHILPLYHNYRTYIYVITVSITTHFYADNWAQYLYYTISV